MTASSFRAAASLLPLLATIAFAAASTSGGLTGPGAHINTGDGAAPNVDDTLGPGVPISPSPPLSPGATGFRGDYPDLGASTASGDSASASIPADAGPPTEKRPGLAGGSVAVDLSGSVDVKIAAPRDTVDDGAGGGSGRRRRRMPLFWMGRSKNPTAVGSAIEMNTRDEVTTASPPPLAGPSVHLLADYNFNEAWYGVRSLGAGVKWEGQDILLSRSGSRRRTGGTGTGARPSQSIDGAGKSGGDEQKPTPSLRDNLSRCTLLLRSDRYLAAGGTSSAEIELTKRLDADGEQYPSSHPPSVGVRVDGIAFNDPPMHLGDFDRDQDEDTQRSMMSPLGALSGWARRWDATRASVALRAPVHRRVDLVSRSTILFSGESGGRSGGRSGGDTLLGRVPRGTSASDWAAGTWLPDVRVSTAGDVEGRCEVGLGGPIHVPPHLRGLVGAIRAAAGAMGGMLPVLGGADDASSGGASDNAMLFAGGVGVRLTVRRRVDWSLLPGLAGPGSGAPSDDDEDDGRRDTVVRLQLCGADGGGRSYSSVTLEAALERPLESARVTLAQEQLIRAP